MPTPPIPQEPEVQHCSVSAPKETPSTATTITSQSSTTACNTALNSSSNNTNTTTTASTSNTIKSDNNNPVVINIIPESAGSVVVEENKATGNVSCLSGYQLPPQSDSNVTSSGRPGSGSDNNGGGDGALTLDKDHNQSLLSATSQASNGDDGSVHNSIPDPHDRNGDSSIASIGDGGSQQQNSSQAEAQIEQHNIVVPSSENINDGEHIHSRVTTTKISDIISASPSTTTTTATTTANSPSGGSPFEKMVDSEDMVNKRLMSVTPQLPDSTVDSSKLAVVGKVEKDPHPIVID